MKFIQYSLIVALVIGIAPLPSLAKQSTSDTGLNILSVPAKKLFGIVKTPGPLESEAIGSYAKGCLAGASRLAPAGPHWQSMRLSRNRHWGHPLLLDYITRLADDANRLDGWAGLLVGDMSQPRGGPMLTGHKSHQLGLDVDIWLTSAPDRNYSAKERETVSAISVRKSNFRLNRKTWSAKHARLLRRAASYPEVARIFVHPTIKQELCDWAKGDRAWLRRIRAWYGHHYHFHVRLKCPDNSFGCKNQPEPPAGDGCGRELAWWFSAEAYAPDSGEKKHKPLALTDLPKQCGAVLRAP